MSVQTKFTERGFAVVLKDIGQVDNRVLAGAAVGMRKGLSLATTTAQREFLSGPRPKVLNARTGRLRGAMTYDVKVTDQRGVTGRFGDNVAYARYHELGFHGEVNVKEHRRIKRVTTGAGSVVELRRKFTASNGAFIGWKETGSRAWKRYQSSAAAKKGELSASFATVKAHTRHIDYAGRPFAAPALAKNMTLILNCIKEGVASAKAETLKS